MVRVSPGTAPVAQIRFRLSELITEDLPTLGKPEGNGNKQLAGLKYF
jgi:hypothetical protein